MSHDRGCFTCGVDPCDYRSCARKSCPNREEPRRAKRVKLVRDRTPRLDDGETIKPANSSAGKILALGCKLHEEAVEVMTNPHDPAEYGDLLTTLIELAAENGVPWPDIERAAREKLQRVGGFSRGMVLIRPL